MTAQHSPTAPHPGEKYRILVVEDDVNIGRLVVLNLNKAGFDCRHAPDGLAGWREFEAFKPHLAILDVMMPGMNGRELCVKIRDVSTMPIIMMTALDSEQDQMQGFKLGADDYVPKPFNPKLLVARVISWLRRVYRYDAPEETPVEAAPTSATPPGWATCEVCGYMGPREKFSVTTAQGDTSLRCPFCKKTEFISFAVA